MPPQVAPLLVELLQVAEHNPEQFSRLAGVLTFAGEPSNACSHASKRSLRIFNALRLIEQSNRIVRHRPVPRRRATHQTLIQPKCSTSTVSESAHF
jgi:hypothetical protein